MNEREATVALLTVIAVLLALNLVVKGTGRAEAQVRGADGEPYVVKRLPNDSARYFRIWSDGQMDAGRYNTETCESEFVQVLVGPAGHPFEVVRAESSLNSVIVEYADGRLDHIKTTSPITRCTFSGQGSDPFCIGDTDRSGVTDFQDIVNVLEDWGECDE